MAVHTYEGEDLKYDNVMKQPSTEELGFTYELLTQFVGNINTAIDANRLANAKEDESKSKYWYLEGQNAAFASVRDVINTYLTNVRDTLVGAQKKTSTPDSSNVLNSEEESISKTEVTPDLTEEGEENGNQNQGTSSNSN